MVRCCFAFQHFERSQSFHLRHRAVEHDDTWKKSAGEFDNLLSVIGEMHLEPVCLELRFEKLADDRVIVTNNSDATVPLDCLKCPIVQMYRVERFEKAIYIAVAHRRRHRSRAAVCGKCDQCDSRFTCLPVKRSDGVAWAF